MDPNHPSMPVPPSENPKPPDPNAPSSTAAQQPQPPPRSPPPPPDNMSQPSQRYLSSPSRTSELAPSAPSTLRTPTDAPPSPEPTTPLDLDPVSELEAPTTSPTTSQIPISLMSARSGVPGVPYDSPRTASQSPAATPSPVLAESDTLAFPAGGSGQWSGAADGISDSDCDKSGPLLTIGFVITSPSLLQRLGASKEFIRLVQEGRYQEAADHQKIRSIRATHEAGTLSQAQDGNASSKAQAPAFKAPGDK
ncbi:hypothetical protein SORBI_3007G089533 [Sorghum bicolor]|uniref:Uncharacterized protein n=1 Tax=Sorghum bicolor TaxID=4558 RepID=A0A1Z5R8R6_SORBI|nr:hypothetical protein SORBI_3007G089533 [Sorghum bicolor]